MYGAFHADSSSSRRYRWKKVKGFHRLSDIYKKKSTEI